MSWPVVSQYLSKLTHQTPTDMKALAPYAHWFLRIALASVFLYHGITKFPNLQSMAEGMGMPVFVVGLLAAMEVAAGVLIMVGGAGPEWATRAAGAIIIVIMLGAIFMVHLKNGWNSVRMDAGMEFQFTLTMIALFFVLVGNHWTKHHDTVEG